MTSAASTTKCITPRAQHAALSIHPWALGPGPWALNLQPSASAFSLGPQPRPSALGCRPPRGPCVVPAIDINEALLRIELDLRQLLPRELVLSDVIPRIRAPHFGRIVVVLRRAIGEAEAHANREHTARMIAVEHGDDERVAALMRDHGIDRLIEVRVLEKPLAPEP